MSDEYTDVDVNEEKKNNEEGVSEEAVEMEPSEVTETESEKEEPKEEPKEKPSKPTSKKKSTKKTSKKSASKKDVPKKNDFVAQIESELASIKAAIDARENSASAVAGRAVRLARIVISIHDSGDAKAMDAYLNYLVERMAYAINIEHALITVIKPGKRKHASVSMFNSALQKIARFVRAERPVSLNIDSMRGTIINNGAINFIASKLG